MISLNNSLLNAGATLLIASSLTLLACGGDQDNDTPSDPVITGSGGSSKGGKGGSSGKGDGGDGGSSGSGGSGKGGKSGSGGSSGKGGKGGTSGTTDDKQECEAEFNKADECWECPQEHEHFLKRCSDSECFPFDNSTIPYLNDDGSVPETLP